MLKLICDICDSHTYAQYFGKSRGSLKTRRLGKRILIHNFDSVTTRRADESNRMRDNCLSRLEKRAKCSASLFFLYLRISFISLFKMTSISTFQGSTSLFSSFRVQY